VLLGLALALALDTAVRPGAAQVDIPVPVRLFMEACVDGSTQLVGARPITAHKMASGSRKALFRASRLEYWDPRKAPPVRFPEIGKAYLTSERPLTYLVPQMPPNPAQSSAPVCVVLTKDKSAFWEAQDAVRLWAKPGDSVPSKELRPKIGSMLKWGGVLTDVTFEAKLGKHSVAVFREHGWIVMRTLDRGDRPSAIDTLKSRKTD